MIEKLPSKRIKNESNQSKAKENQSLIKVKHHFISCRKNLQVVWAEVQNKSGVRSVPSILEVVGFGDLSLLEQFVTLKTVCKIGKYPELTPDLPRVEEITRSYTRRV